MYKTCDLYLASYLYAKGYQLKNPQKVDKKMYFTFECEEVDTLGFYNNDKVGVMTFKHAIGELKTIVMNG